MDLKNAALNVHWPRLVQRLSPTYPKSPGSSTLVERKAPRLSELNHSRQSNLVVFALVIALTLSAYSYPAVRTAFATGSTRLPAVSAPDLGLYLSLSEIKKESPGFVVNPYYHIRVPAEAGGYLKFRTGPRLFGLLNKVFSGRIWWSLLVWNLLWWLILCLSAVWLFESFLPRYPHALALAGMSLLILVGFDGLAHVISATLHSSPTLLVGNLPYLRPFSPQVMMPIFLCYVGLQVHALERKSLLPWAGMAALQFLALTIFPFATLMMAGVTAVSCIWYLVSYRRELAWREVLGYLLVCALADAAFVLHGSALGLGFTGHTQLIQFRPYLLTRPLGKSWIATGVLVTLIAINRKLRPEIKWPLLGMGVCSMLFVMGDAFVAEPVFFMSDHMGFFFQPTIVVLLVFLLSSYLPGETPASFRSVWRASLVLAGLCVVYGFAMAEGNYRANLSYNRELADVAGWFAKGQVAPSDLVITNFSGAAYDSCEWIPLLSGAESLYCRNSQLALTAEQNRDVQRYREVLYLYFDGKDRQWFETTTEFERYGLYGEVSSYRRADEHTARLAALRAEMLPLFSRIGEDDPATHALFRKFRRVWIVQNPQNPMFANSRLNSYLALDPPQVFGNLSVMSASAK